ncbi:MAG TPA: carboxypeptidase regulatory-like domain-containing protein, partial [Vicinamibacterales bacterium]|nr:carboxypeptidase regulatory-like domain-containing protein [Vicinamibacterales bacterium]
MRPALFARAICILLASYACLPTAAWAQQSSIAGLVTDASGSVLPGVTVEASSPALIEKTRVVTTDGTGQYRIVDLRPGVYSVTFQLPSFSTVRRDGIELTVGFTATVNAELRVGAVEETVTVQGSSPVVDIQNVNQIEVITRELIDTIPTGRGFANFATLVPGVNMSNSSLNISQDVGGGTGYNFAFAAIHGGRAMDQQVMVNGMSVTSLTGTGGTRTNWSDGTAQEYGLQLAAHSAEIAYGGVFANILPRDGGNRYSGDLFANFANEDFQADNLDDELRQQGLTVVNKTKRMIDINPSLGGPLRRDKLWFHTAFRYVVTDNYVGGLYYNATPTAWTYTPDLSRPAISDQETYNTTLNLTWQMSPNNRLSIFGTYDSLCLCHFSISPTVAPEAATYNPGDSSIVQGRWTSTLSNNLLVEAGASHYLSSFPREPQPDATEPSILEQSTNLRFRSGATYFPTPQTVDDYRASIAYVTGAHSLKAGFTYQWEFAKDPIVYSIGDVNYRTLNGVPNQVTYYTTPYAAPLYLKPFGLFVQDQLKIRRWTINAGLRYDQFRTSYDAIHLDPVRWLPVARDYPGAEVLNWKDLSPRFGVAYDLFGNGRTALKFSMNRYVLQEGKNNTNNVHPVIAATNSVSRTWTDSNRDF